MSGRGPLDRDGIYRAFREAVTLSPGELEAWLATPESCAVGQKKGGARESVGHASARRILALLSADRASLDEEDYRHMHKVVGFVRRHRAQEPANIVTSRWRYALMNWGHDPLK